MLKSEEVNSFIRSGSIIKDGILIFVLLISAPGFVRAQNGKVLSSKTNLPIGYVNVGIMGTTLGTVSDEKGNFFISLNNIDDKDSLRFSMIGYKSRTLSVGDFRRDLIKNVYLNPMVITLKEVTVVYPRHKIIKLGTEVLSNDLRSGFSDNNLGSELGVKINVRRMVKLRAIHLNVAVCTYDSVTYRLNIYQEDSNSEYQNILSEPIYLSFSKDKIKDVIVLDLQKYSIIVEGNILVALELYKDLGEGKLLFHTTFFTGTTYHRKSKEGTWVSSPGLIGLYLTGQLIK